MLRPNKDFSVRSRSRLALAPVVAPLAFAAVALLCACPTNNTIVGFTPVTGILIRSDSLVAGHGCGTRDDEVFKYAAVVTRALPGQRQFIAAGVYDCFADATFVNLCASSDGSSLFYVDVYSFNAVEWNAALADRASRTSETDLSPHALLVSDPADPSNNPLSQLAFSACFAGAPPPLTVTPTADAGSVNDAESDADAGTVADASPAPEAGTLPSPSPVPVDPVTAVESALAAHAGLTSSCSATQQSNIQVLAVCTPLAPR